MKNFYIKRLMISLKKNFVLIFLIILSACSSHKKALRDSSIENYKPHNPIHRPEKKIVLVGGCFDILHYGHIEFLRKAKNAGDFLIIALEPDENILHFKKRFPTHNQYERAKNLMALRYINKVLLLPKLNGFKDYNQLVKDIRPNIIAITSDDPMRNNKQIQADGIGAELKTVTDRIKDFSSSKIYHCY